MAAEADRVAAVELDLGGDRYPDLGRVLAYWERQRGARFAPGRADIDPADLVEVLPRVMLADVLPDGEFRYRLSGTAIRHVHGREMTGRGPRELMPAAYGLLVNRHYRLGVERRRPMLHLIQLDLADRTRSYARLLLPLSEDAVAVTMLMAIDSREQDTQALRDYFAALQGG